MSTEGTRSYLTPPLGGHALVHSLPKILLTTLIHCNQNWGSSQIYLILKHVSLLKGQSSQCIQLTGKMDDSNTLNIKILFSPEGVTSFKMTLIMSHAFFNLRP